MSTTRFLTGITTTGTPHLGNFVGSIRPSVAASLRPGVQSFYFLADYHALIKCEDPVRIGELEGARCYWCHLPERITYHQRRNAFRASLGQGQLVNIELSGSRLTPGLKGQMLDISATGCRLRFPGDVTSRLQPGEVYERFSAQLPIGGMTTSAEMRHAYFNEKSGMTFVGLRFHRMSGLEQRQVERFVYQLQRESRRVEQE